MRDNLQGIQAPLQQTTTARPAHKKARDGRNSPPLSSQSSLRFYAAPADITRNKEQGKYSLVKKSRVKKLFQRIKAIRNHHAFYNPYSNYRYRVRESQGDWQGTDRRRTSVQDIGGLSTFRILCTKIQYPLIA